VKCLEAFHPSPTLSLYCIQSPPPRYTTRRKNKKKILFRLPRSKKHHALDIDIYTYVTAQAPPPKGVPPAPPIVKMGCPGRNHGFFFLGRPWSVPVVGRSWVVGMQGQSVTVQRVGVSVVRCVFLTLLEIGAVVIVSVMTGHSAEIRLQFTT